MAMKRGRLRKYCTESNVVVVVMKLVVVICTCRNSEDLGHQNMNETFRDCVFFFPTMLLQLCLKIRNPLQSSLMRLPNLFPM